MRLAVLFGGPSEEHDVSLRSARAVLKNLDPSRYLIELVGITREGGWLRPASSRRLLDGEEVPEPGGPPFLPEGVDCVLPVLHGPGGEDGRIQGWCEMLGVPFVGSDSTSSQVALDKVWTKTILRYHQIQVPSWSEVRRAAFAAEPSATVRRVAQERGFPCFVKPNRLGSSIGISRVENPDQLTHALEEALRHDTIALVEPEVPGREFEVAVLDGDPPFVSEPGEVVMDGWYDYEAKYVSDRAEIVVPAQDLHAATHNRLREIALRVFEVLRMRGMARIDFLVMKSSGRVYVNEVNNIPGFTDISMYPQLIALGGVAFSEMLDRLVEQATGRKAESVLTTPV